MHAVFTLKFVVSTLFLRKNSYIQILWLAEIPLNNPLLGLNAHFGAKPTSVHDRVRFLGI
jgi:hypothetical protein